MFVFDRFREIIANGMRDETDPAAEAAQLQSMKKTAKPLKKFVINKKNRREKDRREMKQ
jgi:soluble cytochrome b562